MNIKLYKNNIFDIILLPALLLFIMGCGNSGDAINSAAQNAPPTYAAQNAPPTYEVRRKTGFTLPPDYSQLPGEIDLAEEYTLSLIIKATDAKDDQSVPYAIYLNQDDGSNRKVDKYFLLLDREVDKTGNITKGALHSLVFPNKIAIKNTTNRDFSLSIHPDISQFSDKSLPDEASFLVRNKKLLAYEKYNHEVNRASDMATAVSRMGTQIIFIYMDEGKRADFVISHAPGYTVFVEPGSFKYQTNADAYTFNKQQVFSSSSGNAGLKASPSFAPLIIVENFTSKSLPRVEVFGQPSNGDKRSILTREPVDNFLPYSLRAGEISDKPEYSLRVHYDDQSNFKEESLGIINNLFRDLVY